MTDPKPDTDAFEMKPQPDSAPDRESGDAGPLAEQAGDDSAKLFHIVFRVLD